MLRKILSKSAIRRLKYMEQLETEEKWINQMYTIHNNLNIIPSFTI